MNTYTFFREDGTWHIDAPEYIRRGGNKADLHMIAGANALLNLMAGGKSRVTLTFDSKPFEDAESIELLQKCDPFMDGGYYIMRKYNGREINFNMWLSDITKFVFGTTPKWIFVRSNAG
ncbi:MAG: hypothetical protein M3342_11230 [Bacteroidota bacterium]|nr:hypothetical protein [Flavisolibacter sp.]MDQ3844569.1 hypothetical protein [Bacteroidota bacterium]